MGFPVPLSEWLRGPARGFVSDVLLGKACRERGLFDPRELQNLMANESRYGREIWGALCLELWFEQFIDEREKAVTESRSTVA